MIPLFKGVRFQKIVSLIALAIFVSYSTSLLSDNILAQEPPDTQSAAAESQASYEKIPKREIQVNTSFRPKTVAVTTPSGTLYGVTYGITVEDALQDMDIYYGENTIVDPQLSQELISNTSITVDNVSTERKAETELIPFSSMTYLDDTRELDTTTIVQTGIPGQKRVIYEYTYVNGIQVSKEAVREEITVQPQNEMIALGTMRVFRDMVIGADSFSYWKTMTVYATSYDSNCEGCSNRTALGMELVKGVCAVDPTVIPYYTHFYVPGYGFCIAGDTGGAIKGNKIDLGFEDLALYQGQWSARYVEIYVLD